MTRRTFDPWFCHGCQKHHNVHRWIEGVNEHGKWCAKSIREGIKARRNDLPYYHDSMRCHVA